MAVIATKEYVTYIFHLITRADDSRGSRVIKFFLCPFFSHDISKTAAARITELGIAVFHGDLWKLIYFGVKRSKLKVTSHRKVVRRGSLHSCECCLLLVNIKN